MLDDIFIVFVFFFSRNSKEIFENENLSFNFDIEKLLCLDFFLKFFEFARCFEKGGHYSLSLNSSSENVLTTVSMVIRDGDHSFIMETFFSEGLQCEQEESREQKFGYESKVSLNLLKSFTSLARISFLR